MVESLKHFLKFVLISDGLVYNKNIKKWRVDMKINNKDTTVHNTINQGKYAVIEEVDIAIEETDREKEMFNNTRGLKEKEKEFLHFLYYKFNKAQNFQPLVFTFNELAEELTIDIKNNSYMKQIVNSMARLITTFSQSNGSFRTYSIFQSFFYDNEKHEITIKFNEELIDFIYCDKDIKLLKKWSEFKKKKRTITSIEMKEFQEKHRGNFTVTSHIEITRLTSAYAMELYGKLSQYKTFKIPKEYTINEIRELLSIPKSYTPSMIKKRILEVSKTQINERTRIDIDYEVKGTTKNQIVSFTVKEKKNVDNPSKCKKENIIENEVIESQGYFEDKSLSPEEEETGLKILKDNGISEVHLKNMKKKSIHIYWSTLRAGLNKDYKI